MAKPQLVLHVHAEEPESPLVEAARRMAGLSPKDLPPRRTIRSPDALGALQKLSARIGAPIALSMSNERLARALSTPTERKALTDGVSRGRFLPTPSPGFSSALRLLAPVEVSDELRLNVELWTLALIAPTFARTELNAARLDLRSADPAADLGDLARGGPALVLGVDLAAIEASGDAKGAIQRLGDALANLKAREIAKPVAAARSEIDDMLRRILTQGERFRPFGADANPSDGYDPARDGFPLDLAHRLCGNSIATRSLAPTAAAQVDGGFDPARLDPVVARGLLLRGLARARGPSVDPLHQAVESFVLAVALLGASRVDGDADVPADRAALGMAAGVPAALERWLEVRRESVDAEVLAEAKKRKTRAVRAAPKADAEITRAGLIDDLEKAARAAVECLALLGGRALTTERAPTVTEQASAEG